MTRKNLFRPVIVTALLVFVVTFLFIQFWGTPLRDLVNAFTVLTIYGLLILSYLLRFALIFFGVFAAYRMLWERANRQDYKQMEVQAELK